jgi:chemosensory pili system protein ChpA (sensor histidine kinase/response regulator)
MIEKYLQTFIGEIRSYCEQIGDLTRAARNPQMTVEERGAAAAELTRLFHTIAGLSSSLEMSDLAELAEALETCLLSISVNPAAAQSASISHMLTDLLDFTTAYLLHRVQAMETSGQFQPPLPEDAEPLHALEERLWQLSSQLEPPEAAALPPGEPLSAEDLAILSAFNESDLAAAEAVALPAVGDKDPLGDPAEQASKPATKITHPLAQPRANNAPAASAHAAPPLTDAPVPPEMLELFRVETRDDLSLLQDALARLETPDERPAAVQEMRHVAHKIKGAAATINLQVIADLAHCLEDILDLLRTRRLDYAPAVEAALMEGTMELEAALYRPLPLQGGDADGLERLRAQYEALLAVSGPERADDPDATQPGSRRLAAAAHQHSAPPDMPADQSYAPTDSQHERAGGMPGREPSLRIEVGRLDHLMGLVGELASNRASTEEVRRDINESLAEMRRVVQKMNQLVNRLDDEAETFNQSPQASAAARSQDTAAAQAGMVRLASRGTLSHPLGAVPPMTDEETARREALNLERFDSEYSDLLRALREGVNDIATLSDGLQRLLAQMNGLAAAQDTLTSTIQRDITHLRLVPIGQIFPRLQLAVRMLAQEQNKQINFQASGATTEIDRDIIEAITGPLVQIVRNCAVHGIESVQERRKLGKPDVGTITLHAYYTGNEISIEVGDDGSGINYQRLIAAAVALGKLSPEEAEQLDPERALNLMLLPDISTSPEVTTIAGRGVGMDMVRTVVENLKGTLHIHSTPGEGTSFHIRLPISLGILRALFVRAGQQVYAIPLSSVARIWQPDTQETLSNTPCFSLRELLGVLPEPASAEGEAAKVASAQAQARGTPPQVALIVPLRQREIGIYVDDVLGEREVVIKRLPPHLRRRGVRGVILNPTGELLLLLDLPELAQRALSGALADQFTTSRDEPAPAAPTTTGPKVLVVDDSLFIRRTLELQLTRAGYQVTSARDGLEALQVMMQDRPQLVLLDIEMPQLDGYGLLSILRGQQRFSSIPVAMLTSRAADIHRQHAMSLGASAYLVKPCPHDVLLQTVAELAGKQ